MKLVVLLCATILAANAVPSKLYLEEFQIFKLEHGRVYAGLGEEQLRLTIFSENLEKIQEHNARYDQGLETYEMGVNQFTDLTSEEFEQYLTLRGPPPKLKNATLYEPTNVAVPASIDWRQYGAVTPVKDQGPCGSCWSFSTTGATEGAVFRATRRLISLSEQNLVDCDRADHGCSGGWMPTAFTYIAQHGIASESSYPYTARQGGCRGVAPAVRIRGYRNVAGNENALREAVGSVGPIAIALDAAPLQHYRRGVLYSGSCRTNNPNHAVLAVGYGNDGRNDYWLVKNSWGGAWGENGYFRIIRNYKNNCGVASYPSFPVV